MLYLLLFTLILCKSGLLFPCFYDFKLVPLLLQFLFQELRFSRRYVVDQLAGHIFGAIVDERGQVVLNIGSTVEGRERPRKHVASFSEWVALVVVVSECECLLVVGLRGKQDRDELGTMIREIRRSQNEHRATFLRERVTRPGDVATFQVLKRSHCTCSISSVWSSSRRSSP